MGRGQHASRLHPRRYRGRPWGGGRRGDGDLRPPHISAQVNRLTAQRARPRQKFQARLPRNLPRICAHLDFGPTAVAHGCAGPLSGLAIERLRGKQGARAERSRAHDMYPSATGRLFGEQPWDDGLLQSTAAHCRRAVHGGVKGSRGELGCGPGSAGRRSLCSSAKTGRTRACGISACPCGPGWGTSTTSKTHRLRPAAREHRCRSEPMLPASLLSLLIPPKFAFLLYLTSLPIQPRAVNRRWLPSLT